MENLHKKHLRVGEIDVNFLICHLDVGGFCLVKPACLAWVVLLQDKLPNPEEVDLAVEAKEGGGLSLN